MNNTARSPTQCNAHRYTGSNNGHKFLPKTKHLQVAKKKTVTVYVLFKSLEKSPLKELILYVVAWCVIIDV